MASPSSGAPLPTRWAMILMIAMMLAMLVGMLTFMETGSWPATLLAALATAGAAIPVLHGVLGP
ncbi:hypothetical protein [Actinoplanes xinjiangensis]|uniref:Uncharacterized protein n=1 Tax=Actinoplanes xinjiangensis TaxID=512350 RepID=A0A316F2P4_9ACTN|nr:hypothetical protein [Actinoplanes xinjiangensis]PWK39473.1 hypothetical protein BC793_12245 [Actinoplanes xinjiangensis]GIF42663.1 hypothetical protein Axi01nite_69740 [Actinoplanes xinjiangensis]